MTSSIISRKMDLLWLIFFVIHVPVVLMIDSYPLWPASWRPAFMDFIRQYYISEYKDNFFIASPPFFTMYIYMEVLYHIPLSLWAIYGLIISHPLVPLHLIIYSVQTGITTATCIAEALSWSGLTYAEKGNLMALYVPYLGASVVMGMDMFSRIASNLEVENQREGEKKLR